MSEYRPQVYEEDYRSQCIEDKLRTELAIANKALELACEYIFSYYIPEEKYWNNKSDYFRKKAIMSKNEPA